MSQVSVFLCHKSKDKNFVKRTYNKLNKRLNISFFKSVEIKPWIDEKNFTPGNQVDPTISQQIADSKFGVIFLSKHGIGDYQIYEIMQFKQRVDAEEKNKVVTKDKVVIIPILLPGIQDVKDVQFPENEVIQKSLAKIRKVEVDNINETEIQKTIEEIKKFLGGYHWIKIDLATKIFWNEPFFKTLEKAIKDPIKDNIPIKVPYAVSGGIALTGVVLLGTIASAIANMTSKPINSTNVNPTPQPRVSITPRPVSPEFKFELNRTIESGGNFNHGLARVRINGQSGYIDRLGNIQIPANFDRVLDFSKPDNLALAWEYGKNRGYINNQGKYQINPMYGRNMAGQFSEGKAYACHVSTCGYIDRNGKEVIKRKYPGAGRFSEGLAPVKINGKWGYINKDDDFLIPESFDEAYQFRESLAPVKQDNQWMYIDKNAKPVIKEKFDKISYFSEGLAAVKQDNKWGYINRQGNMVIPLQFDEPKDTPRRFDCDATDITNNKAECKNLDNRHDFSEGLAAIYMNGKWGYINPQGNIVIEPQFSQANHFSERLAYVCQGEENDKKCGYIGHPFNTIITKTLDGSVNLRQIPNIKGTLLQKIQDGSSITILNETINSNKETWYQVKVNNQFGWIRSDLLQ
ncbi:MAG: WG repeat-containing protein [Nostoc sp. ZfuVER08]|jgi:hypothetical protein|nr:WG repeat-containing protein [Nostoc sp. ZfuVER08]